MKTHRPTPKDVAIFTGAEPKPTKASKKDLKEPKKPATKAPQALVGGMGFYSSDPGQK